MAGTATTQKPSVLCENSFIEIIASGFSTTGIIASSISIQVSVGGGGAAYRSKTFVTNGNINGTHRVLLKDMTPFDGSFVNGNLCSIAFTAYVLDGGGMDNAYPAGKSNVPYVGNDLGFALG